MCKHHTWCRVLGSNVDVSNLEEAFARKYADTTRSIRRKHIELKKEEIEEQILTIVQVYSLWGGVFPNQIAKILDIDKSNIIPYTKSLEKKVKINKKFTITLLPDR